MKRWVLALAVVGFGGLVAVLAVGADPAAALGAALAGAVGSPYAVAETLVRTTPLLWCGLAVAIAFRAGVWNIGAEGQLLIGALAATWAAGHLPWFLAAPGALMAGAGAGALWAGGAAVLRQWRGVNEILSTILLNLVAQGLLGWAVHGPMKEAVGHYPQSDPIPAAAWLPRLAPPSRLHLGLLLGLVAAGALAFVLRRTPLGLELRAVGDGPRAALAAGLRVARLQAWVLVVSGALAGLGGAVELLGVSHRLFERFSPGWGYSGIAVALVGGLAPAGVVGGSVLFGGLAAAAGSMQRVAAVPTSVVALLQGLVIVALAARRSR